jgi:dTDP-glucose pyrophosphorylase
MAAGASRRYGRLKQTEPVGPNGEAIVDFGVFDAVREGFNKIVFVVRSDILGDFRATVGRRVEQAAEVTYVLQDEESALDCRPRVKPWGTGHAILSAGPHLEGPFGVINADDFYGARSYGLLHDYLVGPRADAVMIAFALDHTLSTNGTVTRGICRTDAAGRLLAVDETFKIGTLDGVVQTLDEGEPGERFSGSELVSMNMWGFQSTFLDLLADEWAEFYRASSASDSAEFFIPDAISRLMSAGRLEVDVLRTPESWVGLTHPGDEKMAADALHRLTAAEVYPRPLWS